MCVRERERESGESVCESVREREREIERERGGRLRDRRVFNIKSSRPPSCSLILPEPYEVSLYPRSNYFKAAITL